jgi:hypothetical protein
MNRNIRHHLKFNNLGAAAALAFALPAHAALFPNGPVFGLVSVAASQSLRLNLLNTTNTTATCQADIDLVNEKGSCSARKR